ncbi:hypothetical protein CSH63_33185 [Micromonospora tulbaghiae]|uniref:Uncharacterized protein n=1 Tax=Micromonospora tulbaghiae TaxID=479978 RepID=A0A386WTE6_9ACTN|nr:hypothetical protein [Micromonospora tulbaghiae]AYF30599.1 hypothetical protein CSH63_24775 [Micromonospora tulbaghiae]AYF32210.1 hypothetical protein CSH63_33185 [Micromonospora tulbaghiae]
MTTGQLVVAVVTALLGTGGLAWARALFRGVGSLRTGARATERAALADLRRRAEDAEKLTAEKTYELNFWRNIAGQYAYQLHRAGHEPDPPNPVPPVRRGDGSPSG